MHQTPAHEMGESFPLAPNTQTEPKTPHPVKAEPRIPNPEYRHEERSDQANDERSESAEDV